MPFVRNNKLEEIFVAAPFEEIRRGKFQKVAKIVSEEFGPLEMIAWLQRCIDCNEVIKHPFMASEESWAEAGFKSDDFACMSCFFKRLARDVTLTDFADLPVNDYIIWIARSIKCPQKD
jgi:hypothetical protein